MDLIVNEHGVDEHEIVEVRGEVDVHSAPQLRDRLVEVIDAGRPSVIVDLSALQFIDSTGLGALVASLNHAKQADARFQLVCRTDRLLKVFRITGLHEVFEIHPTVEQAIAAS
ncbi:MAG TPA: STAS domain-containing protein [Jatrophihabitans sp.]|nr:STAS domain-containing protein [Jatrophihabitans sp.]